MTTPPTPAEVAEARTFLTAVDTVSVENFMVLLEHSETYRRHAAVLVRAALAAPAESVGRDLTAQDVAVGLAIVDPGKVPHHSAADYLNRVARPGGFPTERSTDDLRSWSLPAPPPDDVLVVHIPEMYELQGGPELYRADGEDEGLWWGPDGAAWSWAQMLGEGTVVEGAAPCSRCGHPSDGHDGEHGCITQSAMCPCQGYAVPAARTDELDRAARSVSPSAVPAVSAGRDLTAQDMVTALMAAGFGPRYEANRQQLAEHLNRIARPATASAGFTLDDQGRRVDDGWDHDGDLIATFQGDMSRMQKRGDWLSRAAKLVQREYPPSGATLRELERAEMAWDEGRDDVPADTGAQATEQTTEYRVAMDFGPRWMPVTAVEAAAELRDGRRVEQRSVSPWSPVAVHDENGAQA